MKYLHVSSANNKVVLDDGTILALKVTGTTNVVDINLKAEEGAKIAGICIFIAGDQNAVNINVGIDTDLISIVGRGNQSEVKINVAKDISVGDVKVNLAGNKPHVLVSGEGSYSCSSTANKGNAPLLECTK